MFLLLEQAGACDWDTKLKFTWEGEILDISALKTIQNKKDWKR